MVLAVAVRDANIDPSSYIATDALDAIQTFIDHGDYLEMLEARRGSNIRKELSKRARESFDDIYNRFLFPGQED